MQSKHWLPRLMVACWAGHIPLVTWLAPGSLSAQALAHGSTIAHFFMLVLAVAAGFSLADSMVNDAMPARYSLVLRDHRHLGFMAMSISLFMLSGVLGSRMGPAPVLIAYILPGIFAAVVVWPDMLSRHQRALA